VEHRACGQAQRDARAGLVGANDRHAVAHRCTGFTPGLALYDANPSWISTSPFSSITEGYSAVRWMLRAEKQTAPTPFTGNTIKDLVWEWSDLAPRPAGLEWRAHRIRWDRHLHVGISLMWLLTQASIPRFPFLHRIVARRPLDLHRDSTPTESACLASHESPTRPHKLTQTLLTTKGGDIRSYRASRCEHRLSRRFRTE
jgi:hypothetical protein